MCYSLVYETTFFILISIFIGCVLLFVYTSLKTSSFSDTRESLVNVLIICSFFMVPVAIGVTPFIYHSQVKQIKKLHIEEQKNKLKKNEIIFQFIAGIIVVAVTFLISLLTFFTI